MDASEKMASWDRFQKALPGLVAQHATSAAVQGAVGAGAAGLGYGAVKVFQAATKARDFRKMLEFNPDLVEHHEADPRMFNQMYTSLRQLNPVYAGDPLIAGTFMRQMVESPNNAGGFLTEALSARKDLHHPVAEGMMQGLKKGPMSPSPFDEKPKLQGRPSPLMEKVSTFRGNSEEFGPLVVPLFTSGFEKVASDARLLPDVVRYIDALRPRDDASYVLVNAMGAGEYYGSNINGDYFSEASLIHAPDSWTGNPLIDKIKSKDWPYGYPTFYYAHPYAHHRNKDANKAFGEVELASWNDNMKRVELVVRVDKKKCEEHGGIPVWDKLKQGMYPDVSMGCKVPFDTCSICLDWKAYRAALETFKPGVHKHPGEAVLAVHKVHPIRGLSPTRATYCEHTKKYMNNILPDGRKIFVYNDYPRFFDISFVFIGADRTAKVMMKIADGLEKSAGIRYSFAAVPVVQDLAQEKTASLEDGLKQAFLGKTAKDKHGEITKDVMPSQFASKAIPVLTKHEKDLPRDLIERLAGSSLPEVLSTTGGMGMVLRPKEFQRIVLIQMGSRPLADHYEDRNIIFPKSESKTETPMGPEFFSTILARLLLPLLAERSSLGPMIEKRALMQSQSSFGDLNNPASLSSELLHKIGSAYNGYRAGLMELIANAQPLIKSAAKSSETEFHKLASADVQQMFTPLTVHYLNHAFLDEIGISGARSGETKVAFASAESGLHSRNASLLTRLGDTHK